MRHLWFQRLTILGLVTGAFATRRHPAEWYAAQVTGMAAFVARLLKIEIKQPDLQLGQHDPDGMALRYRSEIQIQHLMVGLLPSLERFIGWLPLAHRGHAFTWRRILQSYFQSQLLETVQFIAIVENMYRLGLLQAEQTQIFITPRMLGRYVADGYRVADGLALRIRSLPTMVGALAFGPLPFYAIMPFSLALRAYRRGINMAEVAAPGVIMVQYERNELKRYPAGGHYSWFPHSGIPAERVIFYCNRPDSPADKEDRNKFRELGFGCIDGLNPLGHWNTPLSNTLALFVRMLRQFPLTGGAQARWMWAVITAFLPLAEAMRAMARRHRIHVLLQVNECWPRPLLLSLAVQMEGGAFVWSPWAVDHIPSSMHACGVADLMFSWGPWFDGYFRAIGYDHRLSLRTGILGQPDRDESSRITGLEVRGRLAPATRFVIALFDSSYAPTAHQSEQSLRDFLADILSMVAGHPDWAILYKAKAHSTEALLRSAELKELSSTLEGQGRLHCLRPEDSPQTAAHGADVALCYSINSAGFVTAPIVDVPVLHYDVCGMGAHPLYLLGLENKVVFRDAEALATALEQLAEEGNREIGRDERMAAFFDSFRDGTGNRRAGRALSAYLKARDQGMENAAALEAAAAFHAGEAGEASVVLQECRDDQGFDIWSRTLSFLSFPHNPTSRT